MYAVTKTYKDFNGVERTETKLFNLTETEVMEMELGTAGGVAEMLQRIVDAKDQPTIIKFFNISRSPKRFPESLPALSSTIFCLWNLLQMTAKPLNS